MEPLLLRPHVKDYLWGGKRLIKEYGLKSDYTTAAEGWLLSCHKDGANSILSGEYQGKTLPEVLDIWGVSALGKNAEKFPYFPLLIKLIDAKQKLSVQVHPDDEYALKKEVEFGKTEMWYVVDCEEGASLIYGFSEDISSKEFEERIKNNTLTNVCNFVPVHKGDVFFISAGTLHAIGGGILIAEVQQNSNTTYRVCDYGRLGADGKPRPLHIEKAVDVTKTVSPTMPYGNIGEISAIGSNTLRKLAKCDYFTVELLTLKSDYTILCENSFVSLVLLDGETEISSAKGTMKVKKGDSIFIPANFRVNIEGNAEILISYI